MRFSQSLRRNQLLGEKTELNCSKETLSHLELLARYVESFKDVDIWGSHIGCSGFFGDTAGYKTYVLVINT